MVSYDYEQLLGSNKDKNDLSSCSPLKTNGSLTLNPCGVIANSLFNDVISLDNSDVTMRENHIAWDSDLHKKYKQPEGFDWASTSEDVSDCDKSVCPDSYCKDAGLSTGCMGYVCRGGDFDDDHCEAGEHVLYFYRGHGEFQRATTAPLCLSVCRRAPRPARLSSRT